MKLMASIVDQQVGARVEKFRTLRGISSDAAARVCKLDLQSYKNCEAGLRRFTAAELVNLCAALDVTLSEIFANLEL